MFGHELREHERCYDHAEEWLTVVRRLWQEAPQVDFDGEFFKRRDAMLAPKPVRPQGPPVMCGLFAAGPAFCGEIGQSPDRA